MGGYVMHKNCHIRDTNKYLRLEHQRLLEKMPRLVRWEEDKFPILMETRTEIPKRLIQSLENCGSDFQVIILRNE